MRPVLGLLFCVGLVCGLALDSNTIRSSKDAAVNKDSSNENSSRPSRRGSGRSRSCSGPDCDAPIRDSCSNRPRRRQSNRDQDLELDLDQDSDVNKTKAAEMSPCVRSGDCAPGLCCARYLTGKRCQRIPGEGELCLLRVPKHRRVNLGRCECAAGLTCVRPRGPDHAQTAHSKGQGVCANRPRKTRHSGKKRRTAESSC
ncbi:hypothetical protein WMY93_020426 [Mugilogobius chulae]|uniref:Dickkopf-related protein 1/2/4 C-terminal subdomain 1 domain-containing protein n=1 Tax=Mugilogobius chulae TaxID=88201 RepID=A0AAW0NIC6_9GOBI